MTELTLLAGYYQIHAFEEGSKTDRGDAWTDQAECTVSWTNARSI